MSCQGISGARRWVSSVTRDAASPTISMHLIRESTSMRSDSRSVRERFLTKETASRAASSMWRRRTPSSFGILDPGLAQHVVPEIAAEVRGGLEVSLAAEDLGQLPLDPGHPDQPDPRFRPELDEHVDIALR